jgi:hypothetical protein
VVGRIAQTAPRAAERVPKSARAIARAERGAGCRVVKGQGRTVLNEFYRVAFRKKMYRSIDELQADLDAWVREYNDVAHTKDVGASAGRRCKHSWMPCRSQRRR